jgi:hypothetical protein
MEDLLKSAAQFNSGWGVAALLIILLFLLAWRFGNQLISLLQENARVSAAVHAEAQNISQSIITNHGSKNIGDAVDRLTEAVQDRQERVTRLEQKG